MSSKAHRGSDFSTTPIDVPKHNGVPTHDISTAGPPIPPIKRLRIFSQDDWEDFVAEWAQSLKAEYERVERAAGAGDMGRDVVCFLTADDPDSAWDNFQCKHYDHRLIPTDVYIEFGKVCYYTFIGAFSVPRKYLFAAPRDVGTSLSRLFKNPDELKEKLISNWPKYVERKIISNAVPLKGNLLKHVKAFDFSIFTYIPALEMLEGHYSTPFYSIRFGGGLPPRPTPPDPPEGLIEEETVYIRHLMDAYGDYLKVSITVYDILESNLHNHFQRQRRSFFSAEALNSFSRDTLPEGAYENVLDQIYDGVIPVIESQHADGLDRLNKTLIQATNVQITNSALIGRMETIDRHGMCHQLANDDRVQWVDSDEEGD